MFSEDEEAQIRRIVNEVVRKVLLFETAHTRKDFKDKAEARVWGITRHWCLLRYVRISGDKVELLGHWREELLTLLHDVALMSLKGNNSFESRRSVLREVFVDVTEVGKNKEVVDKAINFKFCLEKIDTNSPVYAAVVDDFFGAVAALVDLLARGDTYEIQCYVNDI